MLPHALPLLGGLLLLYLRLLLLSGILPLEGFLLA
jgi:hypothetical protein